jgi:hypothetical protein
MLLISCSQPGYPQETTETKAPETTLPETVYTTPVDVKIDYEAVMAKWNEYLTFADPGAKSDTLNDKVFLFADAEDDNITMKRYGIFLLVTEMHTRMVPAEFDYLPDEEITTGFTYTVYNMKTGKKIINEFVSYDEESTRNAEFEVKVARYNSTYLPVLEVRKGIYVDGTDDEGFITYTYTETYSYVDENGVVKPGYYLYASDALNYLTKDGAQFNYGYKAGYFDDLITKIESVDPNAFEALENNVREAKALAELAVKELQDGKYTSEYKYVEEFNSYDYVYTITNGEALQKKMQELYKAFSDWIGEWEL